MTNARAYLAIRSNLLASVLVALVVAGVILWALHTSFYYRLRSLFGEKILRIGGVILAICVCTYAGVVLTFPSNLDITLALRSRSAANSIS